MAGLASDARFAVAGEASGLLQALGDDDPPSVGSAGSVARAVSPVLSLGGVAVELAPYVESLLPMAQHERALCAMPFALTVR